MIVYKYAEETGIENPFENPFTTIPGAYGTLMDYMKINGIVLDEHEEGIFPCFETDGKTIDIYISCK